MDEYISRKDALSAQNKSMNLNEMRKRLERLPAADVRPVVLCRDCVNYKTKYCAIDIWHEDITIFKARDTDFCSYGERKAQDNA